MTQALGIDIGGTGIKGAVVDVKSGELVIERIKIATPPGGEPDAIVETVIQLVERLGGIDKKAAVGVCFPAAVVDGVTLSAANVSDKWIGLEAERLFEKALKRDIHFINDADAAGVAEQRYGAARKVKGLAILTTLGTGIGTALIHRGHLVPNAELGHLEIDGVDWETRAAYSAMERENLSWEVWAGRLQKYYERLEAYLYPELFIVGGGVSKHAEKFLPLMSLRTPIVPAVLRNNAGILGAAALASDM
ncbi:MAG: polyphosphate glucokinase [Microbacteriaceae bacterium]|jgi:polyphosphate glucokinase|nr:polyphosphate glucokinase [Microbacteriaceae bacterium]HEV7956906.1 ROK family protein [Marisediminicola sp.]